MEELKTKKICDRCKEEKELTEFYSQTQTRKDGSKRVSYHNLCKECAKKKTNEWRDNNRDRFRQTLRNYYHNGKGKEINNNYQRKRRSEGKYKKWQDNNRDLVNEYGKKYREEKLFRLRIKEWRACKEFFNNSCAYCGMSLEEHKEIFNQDLHKEHAINKGTNDLSNCVPSCYTCNSIKHDKDYIDWYTKNNPLYNEERLQLIEQWLNDEYKKYIITK